MPKQIKTIQEFDGGFVDFSAARDISDKEAVEMQNLATRYVGRLKSLGCAVTNSAAIPDIPTGDNLGLNAGSEFYTFSTDIKYDGTSTGGEDWIAYINPTDGALWLFAESKLSDGANAWKTNGDTSFGDTNSIDAKLGAISGHPGYYFADGVLRIANPNSGQSSFAPHLTNGCSSLWIGNVTRDYMVAINRCSQGLHSNQTACESASNHTGGVTQDEQWITVRATPSANFCYGAPLLTPDSNTLYDFGLAGAISSADSTAGLDMTGNSNGGKFALKVALERSKGDGTIKFQGRRLYATYTYDGTQESMPYQLGTITSSHLPTAPTSSTLGYEASTLTTLETSYGSGEIKIDRDVRRQATLDSDANGTLDYQGYKNWDNSGTVTVLDANGSTQSLQYAGIADDSYAVTQISASSGTYTITTSAAHNVKVNNFITISGSANASLNMTESQALVAHCTSSSYSDQATCEAAGETWVGNESGKVTGVTTNTITITRGDGVTATDNSSSGMLVTVYDQCKLTGVIGWVDTGFCNVQNVIESVVIENDGAGYTADTTFNHTEDSGTSHVVISETGAVDEDGDSNVYEGFAATIVTDGSGQIESFTITNHGTGFAAGTIPTITLQNMGSPSQDAVLRAVMSGSINSEDYCSSLNGTWNEATIPTGYTVTFDPPGEIEERDENLGMRLVLTGSPYSDDSIINPIYGGNRLTHINIYTNKYEDDAGLIAETEDYAYVTSFDLVNGWKQSDGTFRPFAQETATANCLDQATVYTDFFGSMFSDNFQGRTGMFPDTQGTSCRWETAVVINRRVYAGNVIMKNTAGVEKKFPDRIIKSIPNKFDTFPDYDTLDVVIDDGDDIVLLETFGGKLLQFKKETLYVIDVTSEPEFLAGSFKYRGIPSKAAAKRTDFGVVFANKYGAYMFNGEETKQLVQNKIETYWNSWYSDDISVSFNPYHNYAIFTKSGSSDFLLHDFITSSWVKGTGNRIPRKDDNTALALSDWFVYDGEMVIAAKGKTANEIGFYKWSDTAVNTLFANDEDSSIYISKEYSFDTPLTDTQIYKVKITYKTSGASSNMEASLLYSDGSSYDQSQALGTLTSTNTNWFTQEFKLSPSLKCKTAKIKLSTVSGQFTDVGFEVNDIAFIFRSKRVK